MSSKAEHVSKETAAKMRQGYSKDRRKRRHEHRVNAKHIGSFGGSICRAVSQWHLQQARLP